MDKKSSWALMPDQMRHGRPTPNSWFELLLRFALRIQTVIRLLLHPTALLRRRERRASDSHLNQETFRSSALSQPISA